MFHDSCMDLQIHFVGDMVLLFVDYCRVDTVMVVEHVKVLLAGHPDLLRGFDEFVPWGYKISQGGQGGQSGI